MKQTPSVEPLTGSDLIKTKVENLPSGAGVYRMLGRDDDVLYVGKAKNLKSRVAAYTRLSGHANRIATMIRLTYNMEFIRTKTEADALLLEANLIQKFKPRFNVLMRDDKSFPYILLAQDHAIAQLTKHRGVRKRKGHYFGPFASAGAVNRTLNTLQRAFLLRTCTDSYYNSRTRPCMLHQIKRCSAPCTGEISPSDYAQLVTQTHQFLSGFNSKIQEDLAAKMQAASNDTNYERAAQLRDRIRALTYVQSSTDVYAQTIKEADIIALTQQGGQSCVQVFFFRSGKNLGNKAYFPRHDRETPTEEILQSFIVQFYEKRPCAKQLIISHPLESAPLIAKALSMSMEKTIKLLHPKRGEKLALLQHALDNANEALARRLSEKSSQQKLLNGVADVFGLEKPPQRIEVFDNSHLQGTHAIGGMIVATRDGFAKNQYRKFNIKDTMITPGDDYGMMREVFSRRYGRLKREEASRSENWPDLILVDGGKGHLSVAREVLMGLGLNDINLVGVAKGPDRNAGREKFFTSSGKVIELPHNSPILYYLQRLRDEAHRFAIDSHRHKRKKDIYANPLDAIPAIGAKRKKALLHHFGSAKAVMRASILDLEKVEGVSGKMAQNIYDYFNA